MQTGDDHESMRQYFMYVLQVLGQTVIFYPGGNDLEYAEEGYSPAVRELRSYSEEYDCQN
jgi:hypothetical protein